MKKETVKYLTGARDRKTKTTSRLQYQYAKVCEYRVSTTSTRHTIQANIEENHIGQIGMYIVVCTIA